MACRREMVPSDRQSVAAGSDVPVSGKIWTVVNAEKAIEEWSPSRDLWAVQLRSGYLPSCRSRVRAWRQVFFDVFRKSVERRVDDGRCVASTGGSWPQADRSLAIGARAGRWKKGIAAIAQRVVIKWYC